METTDTTVEISSNTKRLALRVAKVAVIGTVVIFGAQYLVKKLNSNDTVDATTE